MTGMFKRWLRRRLSPDGPGADDDSDDADREFGTMVRKGRRVALRTHVPANREAFQRWYADAEIAELLRHDLEPLTPIQSRGYFDTFILPSSARGTCFAIHERRTKRLIGTTALTDRARGRHGDSALFRIVIGEKDCWGKGYGTEATRLVAEEAFEDLDLGEVRLEVFGHNARAIAAYTKVGFEVTGEHTEWVPRRRTQLRVIEMRLDRADFVLSEDDDEGRDDQVESEERQRKRAQRHAARKAKRTKRRARKASSGEREAKDAGETATSPDDLEEARQGTD